MNDSDLCLLEACEQAQLIRERAISPVELMQACLERAESVQERFNPFCFIYAEEALKQATVAEKNVMSGEPIGALHGLPVAIKDFTPTKDKTTTRGSCVFEHWVPEEDALIVKRLKAAGAIMLGKTTTPEFAWSSFTKSPLWGNTTNPWNALHAAGGSSGGSAVAVTTGCVSLAEGTDMGGSVRIPAALCGIVGHKPSLGRIPMDIIPSTFDSISHFGPLARSVRDAALFMQITEGESDRDIQSQITPEPLEQLWHQNDSNKANRRLDGLRIALSPELGFYRVAEDVLRNLHTTAEHLRNLGAIVTDVELDWRHDVSDAWYAYWGVYLASAFGEYLDEFAPRMDQDLVKLMRDGQAMSAVEFKQLETIRTQQWHALATIFRSHDILLCPTMTQTAPLQSASESEFAHIDDMGVFHGLDMTSPFNSVAQCPVMSLPNGMGDNGLPTAVQLVGNRFDDKLVFKVAACLELESLNKGSNSIPKWQG